jgi:DNA end-binding protein Ku
MLRYEGELRDPESVLSGAKEASVDADEPSLAKQLINGAPRSWICPPIRMTMERREKAGGRHAKGKPLPEARPEPAKVKVVNILDTATEQPGTE